MATRRMTEVASVLLSFVLAVGTAAQTQGPDLADLLEFASGFFSLVLFSLSIYAWSRRRQFSLLIVSSAFLLFFINAVLGILGDLFQFFDVPTVDFIGDVINFAFLALFFVAIVVKPRPRLRRKRADEEFERDQE